MFSSVCFPLLCGPDSLLTWHGWILLSVPPTVVERRQMVLFWRLHSKTFPRLKDVASNGYGNNNSDRLMDKLRENDDQELSLIMLEQLNVIMMDAKEVRAWLCLLSSCRSEKKCRPTFSCTQSGNSSRQRSSPWLTGICSITLKGNYFHFACQSTARVWQMIAGRLQQCSSILIRALGSWEASSVGLWDWSGTKPLPRNNVSRQDCGTDCP